jgi:hypothetical protein
LARQHGRGALRRARVIRTPHSWWCCPWARVYKSHDLRRWFGCVHFLEGCLGRI